MRAVVARHGCPVVVMQSRGELATMQAPGTIRFGDVVEEVAAELETAVTAATADGVAREQIVIDPGIGFGKTAAHNAALLAGLDRLAVAGRPLLVGASRKAFIAHFAGAAPPDQRLGGSLAAVAWAVHHGAAIVRVHDVAATVQFLRVWKAIQENAIHWARPRPLGEPT